MLNDATGFKKVYLATGYTDLRRGMEGLYMSTENSVNRSLKTRSLLTKFGTCSIAATGAVTTLLLFRSRFHCAVRFRGVCRNRLPYQSDKLCM